MFGSQQFQQAQKQTLDPAALQDISSMLRHLGNTLILPGVLLQ